jgi:hypothetical protein
MLGSAMTAMTRMPKPEVVAGKVNGVLLVDGLAPSEPAPPHAAALEGVGKRPLDDLGAPAHRPLPTTERKRLRLALTAPARRGIAVPARGAFSLRLRDPCLPGAAA